MAPKTHILATALNHLRIINHDRNSEAAMVTCRHANWVRIWRNRDGTGVEVTDRPHRLLRDIRNPDKQFPGLLVLVGNESKRSAVAKMRMGSPRLYSKRGHGDIQLFMSTLGGFHRMPVLIADGDIPAHNRLPTTCRHPQCHEVIHKKFSQDILGTKAVELTDCILHRSIFPLADVVCIFVEDIGGIKAAMLRIGDWVRKGRHSSSSARPRLLLLVGEDQELYAQTMVEEYIKAENSSIHELFEQISVLRLPESSSRRATCRAEVKADWDVLRAQLLTSLEDVREIRRTSRLLFSARHFCQFLRYATDSITKLDWAPFNPIMEARRHNNIAEDLAHHIKNFVTLFDSRDVVRQAAIPLIASSFILDQYPPGMHHFDPEDVYTGIYQDKCALLCETLGRSRFGKLMPLHFETLIRRELVNTFDRFQTLGSSKQTHLEQLAKFRPYLKKLSSGDTCFWCIRRRPRTRLQCIHSICGMCDQIFGAYKNGNTNLPYVEECTICCINMQLVFRKTPKTAKIRALSMDGGGARGIALIVTLLELEKRVKLPFSVIRHFDVVYATSCASGIMLRLCDGHDIQTCKQYFIESARQAFKPRWIMKLFERIPWVNKLILAAIVMITDSKYPSSNLDVLLQKEYGLRRSIMDYSKANEMGILYGVTLNALKSSKTVLATNYNATGQNRKSLDYEMLRPEFGLQNILLWEIIRNAMAAPCYFTPREIVGVGTFQDGGLHANNPVKIAEEEVAALYGDKSEPSTVVSVGTGSSEPLQGSTCFHRIFQDWWSQVSSKIAWEKLQSHQKVGKTTEHFRFDFEFQDTAPQLDDVARMEEVAQISQETTANNPDLDRLANHLRAQLFYFELDCNRKPQFKNGMFFCAGYILCRLEAGTEELETFVQQLCRASATFQLAQQTLPIMNGFAADGISREFRKTVHFRLSSRQESFDIFLEEIPGQPYKINGCPFTLDWLIGQQKLDAVFGTPDHRERCLEDDSNPRERKRRKLR